LWRKDILEDWPAYIHFNAAFFGQFVQPVLKGEHDIPTDGEGIDLHQARSAVCDNLSMNFLWLNI